MHPPVEYLIIVSSISLLDKISLSLLAKEIISLYIKCDELRQLRKSDQDIIQMLENYESKERLSFTDYCLETQFNLSPKLSFWKDQVVSTPPSQI